jgi:hypothetical protein
MRLRATAQILALSTPASTSLPGQTDSAASPKHFCYSGLIGGAGLGLLIGVFALLYRGPTY